MKRARLPLFILPLLASLISAPVHAAIPNELTVQGVLRDAQGQLQTQALELEVRLYTSATGSSVAHQETFNAVPARAGVFNVALTITNVSIFNQPLWLEITVLGGAAGSDEVLPRFPLNSVPYAFHAENAVTCEDVGGITPDSIVQRNQVQSPLSISGGALTLSSAGCPNNGIWTFNGSAWQCVADTDPTYAAIPNGGLTTAVTQAGQTQFGIAPDGVTTPRILNGAVTNEKLGGNAVTTEKILDGTVGTGDLGPNVVTNPKLATDAVHNANILNGAVNSAKVENGSLVNDDISANAQIAFTKLSGVAPVSHTHADGDLSSNVALRNASQTFTGANSFSATTTFTGAANFSSTAGFASAVSMTAGGTALTVTNTASIGQVVSATLTAPSGQAMNLAAASFTLTPSGGAPVTVQASGLSVGNATAIGNITASGSVSAVTASTTGLASLGSVQTASVFAPTTGNLALSASDGQVQLTAGTGGTVALTGTELVLGSSMNPVALNVPGSATVGSLQTASVTSPTTEDLSLSSLDGAVQMSAKGGGVVALSATELALGTAMAPVALKVPASVVVGEASVSDGQVDLYTAGSAERTSLKASPAADASVTYTLPPNAGEAGQVLTTDGTGDLTWTRPSVLEAAADSAQSISTTSATFTAMGVSGNGGDAMSLSLPPGRYLVSFSGVFLAAATNADLDVILVSGGVEVPRTRRNAYFGGINQKYTVAFQTLLDLSAAENATTVEVHWHSDGTKQLNAAARTFTALRL